MSLSNRRRCRVFCRLARKRNALYYRLVVPRQMESPIQAASLQGCGLGGVSVAGRLYNPNDLAEIKYHPSPFSAQSSMSSQLRPTVTHRPSPLERCATEVLQRIVLFAAEEQLPGPPSCILPLLLTSKKLGFDLSPRVGNHLYAKIFKLKFDTAAASRRFSVRWHTNRCLATELRRRFEALNRIRRGIVDGSWLQYDLWTVFLLILEHDHKNAVQLTEWARAHTFVLNVAKRWFAGGYAPEFSENVGGVTCRIIWELVGEG